MLFHLKEPDYKTEAPNGFVTRFYGRNPQQILTALDYYSGRMRKEGVDINSPNLVWWLKRKFSTGDIEHVEKGEFYFITGMIYMGDENRKLLFDKELRVSDDFSVHVPGENIGYFALWRMQMMERERGGLYKLRNPIDMFMNISFVPEDIARAIMNFDLTPYRDAIEQDMARRAELSKHPNVRVDGLQRILEAKLEAKTKDLAEQN